MIIKLFEINHIHNTILHSICKEKSFDKKQQNLPYIFLLEKTNHSFYMFYKKLWSMAFLPDRYMIVKEVLERFINQ